MRFSTTNNPISLIHSPNNINNNLSNSIHIKKILSLIPKTTSSTTATATKSTTTTTTNIKNRNVSSQDPSSFTTPFRKEDDIYRDLRNYYTTKQKMMKKKEERCHHMTVNKQQQYNNNVIIKTVPSDHVREIRLDSNHLRIQAILNNTNIRTTTKQRLYKRNDPFVSGKQSKLSLS
ncbi:uncharacterized protein BX663DRAFT_553277 [Cokeromyces recurvatus]|uniref:uncharacterized protein n=1 Tax=Cokeromyces recurvatus TaxID=90255 RepID=UPI002220A06B|nr:uncharacterized protein BX663DRAFT_553277 [Cokeromyces recurvatus]KAI7901488.1 hypothetical protein BX663DRAFT_553277 [Cokeromyces recurvatus]